jgi:PIN domain nuclease of toxin-antitoxin system
MSPGRIEERLRAEEMRGLSFTDRAAAFARREKYKIITATWVSRTRVRRGRLR